ncbi:hypothetical protein [Bradyrhizobium sp. Tv2a-2]|jgi:hypothetical protein|nr:hypothetical protein [Bradyrhizobium sp. Tv2a-2]
MPFDALILGLAVSVVFVGFAAVLAWADHQSRTTTQANAPTPKRRSF